MEDCLLFLGAYPPDLSYIVSARKGGEVQYFFTLLVILYGYSYLYSLCSHFFILPTW